MGQLRFLALLMWFHILPLWAFDGKGYVQFIRVENLKPFLDVLPGVADAELWGILKDPSTMWYDHESFIPVYQDSVTPILGVRANAIGRELAVDGHKVFDTKKRFHFPFAHAAGLDKVDNLYVLNFWSSPKQNGRTLPVVLWKDDTTRWRWMFPTGTVLGEVMYLKDPDGHWLVFEIRTRKRYGHGWGANAHRPFESAQALFHAIRVRRPDWEQVPVLRKLMLHLLEDKTLTASSVSTVYFPNTFGTVHGALDVLPDAGDPLLVRELLRGAEFISVEGRVWKRNGALETYAASTQSDFSIVPKGYDGGLYPVNEISCNRCHEQTGRQIGEFSFNSVLYGEVWGEDRIFTWHPFDASGNFFGAYHENRRLNAKLKEAGLVENYQPGSTHPESIYKVLPRPFKIHWH